MPNPTTVARAFIFLRSAHVRFHHLQIVRVVEKRARHILNHQIFGLLIESKRLGGIGRRIGAMQQIVERQIAIAVAFGETAASPIRAEPIVRMRKIFHPALERELGIRLDVAHEQREGERVNGLARNLAAKHLFEIRCDVFHARVIRRRIGIGELEVAQFRTVHFAVRRAIAIFDERLDGGLGVGGRHARLVRLRAENALGHPARRRARRAAQFILDKSCAVHRLRERDTHNTVIERFQRVVERERVGLRAVVLVKIAFDGVAQNLRNELCRDGGVNVEFALFVRLELRPVVGIVRKFDAVEFGRAAPIIWIRGKRNVLRAVGRQDHKGPVAVVIPGNFRPMIRVVGGKFCIGRIKDRETRNVKPLIADGFVETQNERLVVQRINADCILRLLEVSRCAVVNVQFAQLLCAGNVVQRRSVLPTAETGVERAP
ncbi:MAG: hypothetical protein HDKAJFGB_03671 [Anaerolineae bacterium]|nr:hypothetical protein [Anaerolineae bacterium]